MKIKRAPGINIETDNGYRITSDSLCYKLERVTKDTDRRSEYYGQKTYSFIGYFVNIENVFQRMIEDGIGNCNAQSIDELLLVIKETKESAMKAAKNNLNITVIEKENNNE